MFRLIFRTWHYSVAFLSQLFDERADTRVQIEQAIEEAKRQHGLLAEQAAAHGVWVGGTCPEVPADAPADDQRPFNSFVDALHKLASLGEVRSQRDLWQRREAELCKAPELVPSGAREQWSRPVPLPRGPIEEYADRAVFVSLGGFALSFLTTRSFQRASAALVAASR